MKKLASVGARGIALALVALLVAFLLPQPVYADPGWYDASWKYRKKITIDHTKVENVATPSTTYADFPVLVYATGLSNINANGTDIRFTSSDGTTELPREIESYSGGTLYAWVKVTLTKDAGDSTDDVIYMYYGNTGASEPAPDSTYGSENVWDANYKGVYHLNETVTDEQTTATHYDSTSNDYDGTQNGNDDTAGKIANGQVFDSNDNIGVTTISAPTDKTYTLWIYANKLDNNYRTLIEFGDDSPWFGTVARYIELYNEHPYSSSQITTGQWYHIAYTSDSGTNTSKIYIDGAEDIEPSSDQTANTDTGSGMGIAFNIGDKHFEGNIDEVRISNTARSANWILTSYNNQSSPSTFYGVGSEERHWESYSDSGHNTQSDYFDDYATEHTIYMDGAGFSASTEYRVVFWDQVDSTWVNRGMEDSWSDGSGNLSAAHTLTPGTDTDGNWHCTVYNDTSYSPSTYDPNDSKLVADDTSYTGGYAFYVVTTAIPEFPTIMAAIAVVGLCFGIYYWMRRRAHRVRGVC